MKGLIDIVIKFLQSLNKKQQITLPNNKSLPDIQPILPLEEVAPVIVEPVIQWYAPIRKDKFRVTQKFLEPNELYKVTGHHPGVDYGTQGQDNVPLYYCSDGEVIESGYNNSCGNYFLYYVPSVDHTFAYFHLRDLAPAKGQCRAGEQCGITGQTGLSQGIHLHLECMKGRITFADRARVYTSKASIAENAEDADAFIRSRLI